MTAAHGRVRYAFTARAVRVVLMGEVGSVRRDGEPLHCVNVANRSAGVPDRWDALELAARAAISTPAMGAGSVLSALGLERKAVEL